MDVKVELCWLGDKATARWNMPGQGGLLVTLAVRGRDRALSLDKSDLNVALCCRLLCQQVTAAKLFCKLHRCAVRRSRGCGGVLTHLDCLGAGALVVVVGAQRGLAGGLGGHGPGQGYEAGGGSMCGWRVCAGGGWGGG